jgi:hypothetical protein
MSDEDDWDFAGDDVAEVTIRAAVRYLLKVLRKQKDSDQQTSCKRPEA